MFCVTGEQAELERKPRDARHHIILRDPRRDFDLD